MGASEIYHIIAAIVVMTIVAGFSSAIEQNWNGLSLAFLFAVIIISVAVFSKKIIGHMLDVEVESKLWEAQRYGFKGSWKVKYPVPFGIILSLVLSLFSLGLIKFTPLLTYETKAKKFRAAKRFGYYSYTEMTEFHEALIGAAGIISVLLVGLIAYFIPSGEYLTKLAAYYAFSNMIPWSSLDGTKIFMGSKILYIATTIITIIFFLYALAFVTLI